MKLVIELEPTEYEALSGDRGSIVGHLAEVVARQSDGLLEQEVPVSIVDNVFGHDRRGVAGRGPVIRVWWTREGGR